MPAAPVAVSPAAARRFLRAALGLEAPHPDVGAALAHHGAVQLDPINVCGRMHDLILRNRVAGYREGDLLRHLHGPEVGPPRAPAARPALEQSSPHGGVLCAFPIDAWPYLVPVMEARRRAAWRHSGRLTPEERPLARRVLAELADRGPLSSDDIAHEGRSVTAWGSRGRLVKAVLDKLFFHGRVLITARRGFRRIYDLAERVVPPAVLGRPRPTAREAARFWARLRVRQRRLVLPPRAERLRLAAELQEVRIPGCPPCFCLAEDVPALLAAEDAAAAEGAEARGPVRLLAPLDPLIYDRRLTAALWGFEYTWEVYTPPAQRVRGYYALPVLCGDRLVGHVEPRADRERGRLVMVSRNVKRGVPVQTAVRELAGFLGLR